MKTVLVADDEQNIVDLIVLILGDRYRVLTATDGESALRLAKEERPDLILLDVMMPKADGFEICKQLKGESATAGIKIAMLSAKAQEKDIAHAKRMGADDYITKPFDPVMFEQKVEELLS
jgi:DNA-binding response OmpR family regulator